MAGKAATSLVEELRMRAWQAVYGGNGRVNHSVEIAVNAELIWDLITEMNGYIRLLQKTRQSLEQIYDDLT
jgi:hypothetical protein